MQVLQAITGLGVVFETEMVRPDVPGRSRFPSGSSIIREPDVRKISSPVLERTHYKRCTGFCHQKTERFRREKTAKKVSFRFIDRDKAKN